MDRSCNPHRPNFLTDTRSRAQFTPSLPHINNPCMFCIFHVQPEDGHYQEPKHVAVPYVENTLYSTNKYSCFRPVHTLYISYFIEHNGDDERHNRTQFICKLLYMFRVVSPPIIRSTNIFIYSIWYKSTVAATCRY